jgi:DNA-directed RNA polymerase II subunit RPB2
MQTRQPTKGKKHNGGIRYGEQEGNAALGHGAPSFLRDRTFLVCDPHFDIVCKSCRLTSISNFSRDLIICQGCHGNDFVKFEHPYTLTLLINYASAVGVNITPYLGVSSEAEKEIEFDIDHLDDNQDPILLSDDDQDDEYLDW